MKEKLEEIVEIRNQKGEIIWSVWLTSNQARDIRERIHEQEELGGQSHEGGEAEQVPGANDDPMTDAQKRYIFRILAGRGIEGEAAYLHLKKEFGVDSLKEITKFDASRAIDQMLNG